MNNKLLLLGYTAFGKHGLIGLRTLLAGYKATITARLNEVALELRGFPLGEARLYEWGLIPRRLASYELPQQPGNFKKQPSFVAATGGAGTIPALLSVDGRIGCCGGNAIARVLARAGSKSHLYGHNPWETAQIDMFLDRCLVFENRHSDWIDAALDDATLSDDQVQIHCTVAESWLLEIDTHLRGREFLVGTEISIADVVLACLMVIPWCRSLDNDLMTTLPNLGNYLENLWRMSEFKSDLEPVIEALTDKRPERD